MESPKPERIGRRKQLVTLEYAATGDYPTSAICRSMFRKSKAGHFAAADAVSPWYSRQAAQSCG
jgi:hypothetical protein